jgi:hypothetical protein
MAIVVLADNTLICAHRTNVSMYPSSHYYRQGVSRFRLLTSDFLEIIEIIELASQDISAISHGYRKNAKNVA